MKNICNTRKNGLSPLARGARHSQADPATALRFIPAGAGNTVRRGGSTTVFSVYPRWRGEHINMQRERLPLAGLSPLARGTQSCVNSRRLHWRFIPAGAGNTGRNIDSMFRTTVYPRWRGEHSKHNLLLINDFLSQSQSTNFIVSHKQHIHYVKEHLIH
ncbi:Domain of uncharacterised function (DUF2825) [Escherichia coli]|nr:Domain of uncharacterised function (DUF2825) [Escherichia coli]CTS06184.1 Domain of uncharacterised function (DUF2825) [Escherichia coli]CTS92886.1 Domain of uncharacterised function (DUF2825) [Escherichia coli]CTV07683.1 Domain of uncharacterised function (DUF2825) [Escherichia coli]CTV27020.1 Domain of uncharacterised function (DUF2825) [Escherichia coli]